MKTQRIAFNIPPIKKEKEIYEREMSMYDTEGMEDEEDVVKMDVALLINKNITQHKNLTKKNKSHDRKKN